MINKLVIENLKHRWIRTLLSALVVGVQVMSILTLIGLSRGLLQQSAQRARGTGADIFLKPDTHGTFSFSQAQINERFVPFVAKQPHVAQAVGVLSVPIEVVNTLNGVNFVEFEKLNSGIQFVNGAPPQNSDDLLVDEYYARQHHLKIGQPVSLMGHNWRLSGIIAGGVLGRFIAPLPTLQRLTGNAQPARISEILVKLDDSSLTNQEVTNFNQLLKGNLQAISVADFVSQFNINNIPDLKAFIGVVTVLAVVVGFLVVFLSMYTAVVERTREIGILKALGAKPAIVLSILVREAFVLALIGWLLGIVFTFAARGAIMTTIPASLPVVNVPDWWPIAALIALTGALLGAVYPGWKAARQDAIEALAYE